MANIWTLDALPAVFNGLPITVQVAGRSIKNDIAQQRAVGLFGATLEPNSSGAPAFPITAVFAEGYFQAHKLFEQALNLCVQTYVPGTLVHPIYGVLQVFPEEVETEINAAEHVAVVRVRFLRQNLAPEELVPAGAFFYVPFDPAVGVADLTGYLALLAMVTLFGSQALQAMLALMNAAGSLPSLVADSIAGAGQAFCAWIAGKAAEYADSAALLNSDLESRFRRAWDAAEAVRRAMVTDWRLDESLVDDIAAGQSDYDGGQWVTGLPAGPNDDQPPPPRDHAGLVAVALWSSQCAGALANRLLADLRSGGRDRTVEYADAVRAVVAARRALAAASRLTEAALGPSGSGTCRELSLIAHALFRLVEQLAGSSRRGVAKEFVVDYPAPLLSLAQRLYGDGSRADEIRALNPDLNLDFNRLPRGARLLVPVE